MSKQIKIITVLLLLVAVFAVPASALDLDVYITPNGRAVATNTKDRAADSWLITIYRPSDSSEFTEGTDVLGLRIRNTSGAAMTDYFTYDEYVTNFARVYTSVPSQGQTVKLHAQSDDSGTRRYFYWDGQWFT